MNRSPSQLFATTQEAQRFVSLRSWFSDRVELNVYKDPTKPVMSVNDNVMSAHTAVDNARIVYVLPFVLALWVLTISFIQEFGPNPAMIDSAHNMIELNIEQRESGQPYDEHRDLYYRALVGEDGKGSKLDLITAVSSYGDENYRKSIYQKMAIISVFSVLSLVATILFARWPRAADIYFDRSSRIVYTWRNGRVSACHFDNLGFRQDKIGLHLFVYGEKKKGTGNYWAHSYCLQPTGKAHMNTEKDSLFFMAQIFAFMDKGKNAVITGDSFERPQPKTYLFVDKKPNDFDAQLSAVLQHDHLLSEIYETAK